MKTRENSAHTFRITTQLYTLIDKREKRKKILRRIPTDFSPFLRREQISPIVVEPATVYNRPLCGSKIIIIVIIIVVVVDIEDNDESR